MSLRVPVVLFVYARTEHLIRVLGCLRENRVPCLEVYSDGPKNEADVPRVAAVRDLVRSIDWCEVRITERPANLGLGRNILTGVDEVAARHQAFIVWEDDLIAVPGMYDWICAALEAYRDEPRVMSVSGWNHPRVIPADVRDQPYFDGRAECWVWGTWARAWRGMTAATAEAKLAAAQRRGLPPGAYGADLPAMARVEAQRNIWAVRWLYHHLEYGGLCVRPPWSMVEHIGLDPLATNAQFAGEWSNPPLRAAPPVPGTWPVPREHPACQRRWRAAYPSPWRRLWRRWRGPFGHDARAVSPAGAT